MKTMTMTLSDERLAELQALAARFHMSLEELVRVGVGELLARPDDTCQRAINHILTKVVVQTGDFL